MPVLHSAGCSAEKYYELTEGVVKQTFDGKWDLSPQQLMGMLANGAELSRLSETYLTVVCRVGSSVPVHEAIDTLEYAFNKSQPLEGMFNSHLSPETISGLLVLIACCGKADFRSTARLVTLVGGDLAFLLSKSPELTSAFVDAVVRLSFVHSQMHKKPTSIELADRLNSYRPSFELTTGQHTFSNVEDPNDLERLAALHLRPAEPPSDIHQMLLVATQIAGFDQHVQELILGLGRGSIEPSMFRKLLRFVVGTSSPELFRSLFQALNSLQQSAMHDWSPDVKLGYLAALEGAVEHDSTSIWEHCFPFLVPSQSPLYRSALSQVVKSLLQTDPVMVLDLFAGTELFKTPVMDDEELLDMVCKAFEEADAAKQLAVMPFLVLQPRFLSRFKGRLVPMLTPAGSSPVVSDEQRALAAVIRQFELIDFEKDAALSKLMQEEYRDLPIPPEANRFLRRWANKIARDNPDRRGPFDNSDILYLLAGDGRSSLTKGRTAGHEKIRDELEGGGSYEDLVELRLAMQKESHEYGPNLVWHNIALRALGDCYVREDGSVDLPSSYIP